MLHSLRKLSLLVEAKLDYTIKPSMRVDFIKNAYYNNDNSDCEEEHT